MIKQDPKAINFVTSYFTVGFLYKRLIVPESCRIKNWTLSEFFICRIILHQVLICFGMGVPQPKPRPLNIWWPKLLWKKRRNIFNLLCDITWPREKSFIWINGWETVTRSHHFAKFVDNRSCGKGDMFLICNIRSCDQVIKIHINLWLGIVHLKSPISQVWWL